MRDIIKALKASVQALAQDECEATGGKYDPCFYPSYDRTADCETAYSRNGLTKPKDYPARRFDTLGQNTRTDNNLPATRAVTIKLLRSKDLCCEQPTFTKLKCDYCNCTFLLQDGGAFFDGKAACAQCEQQLNRDVVLPAICQSRAQLRQASKTTTTS